MRDHTLALICNTQSTYESTQLITLCSFNYFFCLLGNLRHNATHQLYCIRCTSFHPHIMMVKKQQKYWMSQILKKKKKKKVWYSKSHNCIIIFGCLAAFLVVLGELKRRPLFHTLTITITFIFIYNLFLLTIKSMVHKILMFFNVVIYLKQDDV